MLKDLLDESDILRDWQKHYPLSGDLRLQAHHRAESLAEDLRRGKSRNDMNGLAGKLLNHYHLGSEQALALMELAEAYPRITDVSTRINLLQDKLLPPIWLDNPMKDWLRYDINFSVKAVIYSLMSAQKLLNFKKTDNTYKRKAKNLMTKFLVKACDIGLNVVGKQFVIAEYIKKAYYKCRTKKARFSYDMLGETALTEKDALRYFKAYKQAIEHVGSQALADNMSYGAPHQNKHGISIKLSTLYGRYELLKSADVHKILLPRLLELLELCKSYNIGLTIDAEEIKRLELSLQLIKEILSSGVCRHWQGLSIAVQAYNKRAEAVIDTLCTWTQEYNSLIAIRLVKGAYWDSEIKEAQSKGLADFHTYSVKSHTDIAYICLAHKLLESAPMVYPQFATHNAYSAAAITVLAEQYAIAPAFEFQRLYGMGEILHRNLEKQFGHPSRTYVPVGEYKNLLPYLIRRLLENSSSSSFVHQCSDATIPTRELIADPLHLVQTSGKLKNETLKTGSELFLPERKNSQAIDLDNLQELQMILQKCEAFKDKKWGDKNGQEISNPCNLEHKVGTVKMTEPSAIAAIAKTALTAQTSWEALSFSDRGSILNKIADLYEDNMAELLVLLMREGGKILQDGIDEIREAIDFCRYYAMQADKLSAGTKARGLVLCISPYNFPLAIFTGQIAAALVSGNAVLAKPAEQTCLIAMRAIELMHKAGVPQDILQPLFLNGVQTYQHVIEAGLADMVAFTGSDKTAKIIEGGIIKSPKAWAPLVAETGGINAMIIDSSALLEQAVSDVIESAFRSAGQRCSALRIVYVQKDIYEDFMTMLCGAMDLLKIGDSSLVDTDVSALIDKKAFDKYSSYIKSQKKSDIVHAVELPNDLTQGYYAAPILLHCEGIADISDEIFAPILHVASFKSSEVSKVVEAINERGYGLTFCVHSRLNSRCLDLSKSVKVGNFYINRNQVGAVVGVQPFGGIDLSGTGPKAGGALYLSAFCIPQSSSEVGRFPLSSIEGEENVYELSYTSLMVCGDDSSSIISIARDLLSRGCLVSVYHEGISESDFGDIVEGLKSNLSIFDKYDDEALCSVGGVIWAGSNVDTGFIQLRRDLHSARLDIVSLSINFNFLPTLFSEKVISRNLSAIGGNADLLV